MKLRDDLKTLREHLSANLLDREIPARLVMLALLAGEHVLLLGPPGTAKSELARRLSGLLTHATCFERLLTRFSVPEELFGPLSIKALEQDRYERQLQGYLPSAEIAFIDEIFKANSAILNALLTLLNERKFDNGARRISAPLRCLIGASNELPEGDELGALYDRFLLRFPVQPLGDEHFEALLRLDGERAAPPIAARLSQERLELIQRDAAEVALSSEIVAMLTDLRRFAAQQNPPLAISDRRWRQIKKLLQVAAYTNDRVEVTLWDAWMLPYCALQTPEDLPKLLDWYRGYLGVDRSDFSALSRLLEKTKRKVEDDLNSSVDAIDDKERPLYWDGNKTTTKQKRRVQQKNANGELLYKNPNNPEQLFDPRELQQYIQYYRGGSFEEYIKDNRCWAMIEEELPRHQVPRTYDAEHKASRRAEVQAHLKMINDQEGLLQENFETLQANIKRELWLPEALMADAERGFKEQQRELSQLSEQAREIVRLIAKIPTHKEQ